MIPLFVAWLAQSGFRDVHRLDHSNKTLALTSGVARSMLRLLRPAYTYLEPMLAMSTIPPPLSRLLRLEHTIDKRIYLLVIEAHHPCNSRRLSCRIFIPPNHILELFAIQFYRVIVRKALVRTPVVEEMSTLPFLDNLWV